jgi:hypothetical protein
MFLRSDAATLKPRSALGGYASHHDISLSPNTRVLASPTPDRRLTRSAQKLSEPKHLLLIVLGKVACGTV